MKVIQLQHKIDPRPCISWTFLPLVWLGCCLLCCASPGLKGRSSQLAPASKKDLPVWLTQTYPGSTLCGLGIAGPSLDIDSPYPKQLSRQRAVANLAGIVATTIQEAFAAQEDLVSSSIELAQSLHVDEQLIARLDEHVELQYFRDTQGAGPYGEKDFTYARACIGEQQLSQTIPTPLAQVARQQIRDTPTANPSAISSHQDPPWLQRTGKYKDGRLCAVGFSQPTFFAEETFEEVVRDIQTQLAKVVTTLIASATQEWSHGSQLWVENITVATTEALAKGVVVTQFWYDQKGQGPQKTPRSTYGFGCAYPMDVLEVALQQLPEVSPDMPGTKMDNIRQRAEIAFSSLEQEIDTHAAQQPKPHSSPQATIPSTVAQDNVD